MCQASKTIERVSRRALAAAVKGSGAQQKRLGSRGCRSVFEG